MDGVPHHTRHPPGSGEKLTRVRPATFGQASVLRGVTPAAEAILDIYLTLNVSRETPV
jgi:tRNA U34 5-carboxymethylaminomethyl modifying enzyme MnmG/GidA